MKEERPKKFFDTLSKPRNKIALIQPFGLGDSNGGARILRSIATDPPIEVVSCNTSPYPASPSPLIPEFHLPTRPLFGRLERTRFAWIPSLLDPFWLMRWTGHLKNWLNKENVSHVHVVPHNGVDFIAASNCARDLALPFSVSVHDHPRYCFKGQPGISTKLRAFGEVWRQSVNRFVISEPMGRELCREFGQRSWEVITDGVTTAPLESRVRASDELQIYFMGLFHQGYQDNLRALLTARKQIIQEGCPWKIHLRLRCGALPAGLIDPSDEVEVLPFSSQEQVQQDMEDADLLYLPLPFGEDYSDFVRYSLSTKMVTYLGSGRPILLHAPSNSAAAELLLRKNAATHFSSLSPNEISKIILNLIDSPQALHETASNALRLASAEFNIHAIRSRFWSAIQTNPV